MGFSLHTLENFLNHISRAAAYDFLLFVLALQGMKNTNAYKLMETNYACQGLIMWHNAMEEPMLHSKKVGAVNNLSFLLKILLRTICIESWAMHTWQKAIRLFVLTPVDPSLSIYFKF